LILKNTRFFYSLECFMIELLGWTFIRLATYPNHHRRRSIHRNRIQNHQDPISRHVQRERELELEMSQVWMGSVPRDGKK
jgi:hypothetical protein